MCYMNFKFLAHDSERQIIGKHDFGTVSYDTTTMTKPFILSS